MMDWVGVFNAYADAGKPRAGNGSVKDKASALKRSSSARTEHRTSPAGAGTGLGGARNLPKSASAACVTVTAPTKLGTLTSVSVLSSTENNETRDGIYRYEMSEPVRPRRGGRDYRGSSSSDHRVSACLTKSQDSNAEMKRGRDTECKETNIFVQIKRNLINSLLLGITKQPQPASEPQSPRQSSRSRSQGVSSPSPGDSRSSSQQECIQIATDVDGDAATGAETVNLSQNLRDDIDSDIDFLGETSAAQVNETEIFICTCSLIEDEDTNDYSDNEELPGTMPRNSNHYVHPSRVQLPPASTATNSQSQSRYANTRCKVHFQSNTNGRKHESLKGLQAKDHNQNNSSNGNGNKNDLYHQQMQNGSGSQQQQETTTTSSSSSAASGPRLPPIQQQKKEFIPHFVLLDACKSVNEKKIIELVKKLAILPSDEVSPIANFQDQAGRTPLSYTCSAGNVLMVEELSKLRRLDPNLADTEGNTPLHYAAQAGHSEVVDLLLSRFIGVVDLNCRNSIGLTPLMKAALQGRTRCAKSLITSGANPYLRDCTRQLTAEGWARLCGRHICAEVIVRSSKDYFRSHPKSPSDSNFLNYQNGNGMHQSKSNMELKRMNSDESPYYHLYTARNAISGVSWLKNKVKKAIGGSTSTLNANAGGPESFRPSPGTYALVTNLSNATICASSLLLPSIKPLLDDRQKQIPKPLRKMHIPSVQVTPVRR